MKKSTLLLMLPGLMAVQGAFAQANTHLKLSTLQPAAGEKVTFTYDANGTPVDGKSSVAAAVYFVDGKDYPVEDVSLQTEGKVMKGAFTIPATAKAFYVKLSTDDATDNNDGKGYIFPVYKGKQPVEGAYAAEAYVIGSGMGSSFAKITMNVASALDLYKKEFALYPKNTKDLANYSSSLLASKDTNAVKSNIATLWASDDETNMIAASNLYKSLKLTAKSDSLTTVIKAKFPAGELNKRADGLAIGKETDAAKKEELYNEFIKKYPEANEKKTVQDNYRVQVASAYLAKGDMENYNRVAAQVKDKTAVAGALNNAAYEWAKIGEHLTEAEQLSKQALDLTTQKMNGGGQMYYSAATVKKMYQRSYDMYTDTYSFILYKQGKFAEAVKLEQPVYDKSDGEDAEVTEHYAQYLKAAGDFKKATEVIETAVKKNKSTDELNASLKDLYVKAKGSDTGFDTYFAGLKSISTKSLRGKLAKEMIKTPAPAFALKDFTGATVSLASLKGKVVVVDFWATWCGPCKASFPGMQLALRKFENDPNVKFVFIDTWETGDNFLDGVKKFIADNKYSFHVLIDEKGADGRQSKVVSSFGVSGIPTKFVIDANGNIRFKHIGFMGNTNEIVDEVTTMIDMAAHPDAITTGEKVSMNVIK